jgi:capsular polysaccharide biosynthesis protein
MDKLLFWLGIGAAQKGARSKEVKPSRNPVTSFVVGVLIALLIAVGMFILLVSQR